MDMVMDFFKSLPNMLLDQILHPPFKLDPTVENTALGLIMITAILVGIWIKNRGSR